MTAYLQPGDCIHLAFPISRTKTGDALASEIERTREYYTQSYAIAGIEVLLSDPEPTLDAAVVVAVFRSEPKSIPAPSTHPFAVDARGNCRTCGGSRYDSAHAWGA